MDRQGEKKGKRNKGNLILDTPTCHTSGFTLMELIVVIAILGVVMSVVIRGYIQYLIDAKQQMAYTECRQLKKDCAIYKLKVGRYPERLEELAITTDKWKGEELYEDGLPKDPWGGDYVLEKIESNKIKIISYGADKEAGGEGENRDITSEDKNIKEE